VSVITEPGNLNLPVAALASRESSHSPNYHLVGDLFSPPKYPGCWFVIEKLAQSFGGKIGLSHEAVLSLTG
jgi:hypothetical protein